jgi:methylaspartate ammonia-lyase
MADEIEHMEINGSRLHTAIRYGLSQALLDAVAKSKKKLMCEIVAEEYGTKVLTSPVNIFSQTGDARCDNADKAILKGAEVMPHGLINNIETKLGANGEILLDYLKWLSARIIDLRVAESYDPIIHIDVYGLIGQIYGNENYEAMIEYFKKCVNAANPFRLRIEGPMDVGNREGQMRALSALTKLVDESGLNVEIVADEWCNTLEDVKYFADNKAGHMLQIKTPDLGGIGNTVEAVLYCKGKGVGAYQGGTCNETDRSAHVCVHIAMATGPDQILAKPGMGVDEGYMTVYNEMSRIIALLS